MFINIGNGEIVNLNNVDKIFLSWDDECKDNKGIVKFIKCLDAIEAYNATIGIAKFNTKKDMNAFVDKYIVSLQDKL